MVQTEFSFYCAESKGEFPVRRDATCVLELKIYQTTGAVATAAIVNNLPLS